MKEVPRLDIPTLRAAWWAQRALVQARRELRREGIESVAVAPPPSLPAEARRGVLALLRRRECTCLERSLVLQRWHASQGDLREVVIGVAGPTESFRAHAWLEGEPNGDLGRFQELMRLPAR